MCAMRAPKIYSLRVDYPLSNAVLLTIVITLYKRSLDLLILYYCNLVPFDQCLPISAVIVALSFSSAELGVPISCH